MILDNKGKLFGKVSIIDLLIVVIVLAAVAGVGYKFAKSKVGTAAAQDNIQIVFYAEEVPEYAVTPIKKGDLAKDGITNAVFGVVTDVVYDKSVSFAVSDKGEINRSYREGYVSVKITVEGKGVYSNSGVSFDGSPYYIGHQMDKFRAGNSGFNYKEFKVYDIKKKG